VTTKKGKRQPIVSGREGHYGHPFGFYKGDNFVYRFLSIQHFLPNVCAIKAVQDDVTDDMVIVVD